ARASDSEQTMLLLLDVFVGLSEASGEGDEDLEESRARVIFEKFANAAIQRGQTLLASAAWNLIYEWYDQPYQRNELRRFSRDAINALAVLQQDSSSPDARQQIREQLNSMPIGAFLGALPARFPSATTHGQRILRLLL